MERRVAFLLEQKVSTDKFLRKFVVLGRQGEWRPTGNENHHFITNTNMSLKWFGFSLSYVGLYSNCQLRHILLLFVETEAVIAVFNFVDVPKQKMKHSVALRYKQLANGKRHSV
jgi:hypothetical protein